MTHPFRRRVGAAAALLAAVAVFVATGPQPAAAEPEKLPPGLNLVPSDAAFFAHADVEAILKSKIGQAARAAKAKDLDKVLTEVETKTGITLDTVKTATVFFSHLEDGAPVFHVTFTKPYDKARVVKAMTDEFKGEKVVEASPGVYEFREDRARPADEKGKKKKDQDVAEPELTVDLSNPMAISVARLGSRKYLKPTPAKDGPQTPALKAAAGGMTATVGLNFAAFPDEVRGDNLPAEVRAFAPLFQSDAAVLTAKLDGDKIRAELRFRSDSRKKVADAEKSLAAGSTLIQTALSFAILELTKSGNDQEKAVLPLAQAALEVVKAAKISTADTEATVAATVPGDLPVGPFVQMVFGGTSGPQSAAARAKDSNNLKQIGLALHNYHDVYEGFPPAALVDKRGKPMLSWRVMILPFIEQDALYKEFKLDEPWDSEHNKKVFDKHPMPPVYALPGVTKDGEKNTHYMVFVGNGAGFDTVLTSKLTAFADGTSNTVLVAPGIKAVPWTKPDDIEFDPKVDARKLILFGQNGGANVAFADGSVRFLKDTIKEEFLRAIITKSGGEVINFADLD